MVCLRLRGWKGRSNRGATTTLQQRHCPAVMAATVVDQETGITISSSPSEKFEPGTGTGTGTEKRFKFLCSYGGKILLNPSDGQLKYVGGETRVFCVLRSVSFLDLKKKIEDLFMVGDIVIKYRLMSEDLDTLISIRCNEDLIHMWDEYDRILPPNPSSASRFLRLFLFPSSLTSSLRRSRRYLDAINMEPSREYHHHHHHGECHCDDRSSQSTEQSGEFPRFNKEVHRVWSTPNLLLQGTTQAQRGHLCCNNHVQQQLGGNSHSHSHQQQQAATYGYQNVRPQPLQNIERLPIRAPSYKGLPRLQSPRSAVNGNGAHNGVYGQNLNPVFNGAGEKNVPPEIGSVLYLQHSRSGPATPVGRWSKAAGTNFQVAGDEL